MISVHIASIPDREDSLRRVIEAFLPRVDRVFIALNGYPAVPGWMKAMPKVKGELLDNSLKDCAKFLFIHEAEGLCFVHDDDLIPSPDYTGKLMRGLKRYGGVVGVHGKVYPRPVETFRRWKANYRCLGNVSEDVRVDILGTGCMLMDSTRTAIDLSVFEYPGIADITFARMCAKNGIRQTVLRHNSSILTYVTPQSTIWRNTRDFTLHNKLLNEFLLPHN